MDQSVEIQYLRPNQILQRKKKNSIVYLPVGPLEWHGPHLPLGTDPLRAQIAAVELAREIGGVVMPTLYIGTERERSPEMLKSIGFAEDDYVVGMDFPRNALKSLYLKEEVFALVLRNYLEMLIDDWKFKNVVIVNGHGAENHLNVIQRLRREFVETTDAKVILIMPLLNFPDNKWSHATREETETLMAYLPESVDLSALPPQNTPLANTEWAIVDDLTFRGTPTKDFTVRDDEDPRSADPDTGREVLAETIQHLKTLITSGLHVEKT